MTPPYLHASDQIRIISPSGIIQPEYIDGAKKTLADWGFNATEGQFARQAYGRFAGTTEQRLADLQEALDDTSVKAILCSRGGYGIAQLIDKLDFTAFKKNPKWLIGFSDVTLLHNALSNIGVASIHAIMAKHLTELPHNSEQLQFLKNIITGKLPHYTLEGNELNKTGQATGVVVGGNLSLLLSARGTNFDLNFQNKILFIEDIAEKPYHIDRMMQNLRFGGVLQQLSGLIVGQFSDCEEDPQMMQSISEIIRSAVNNYNYPVCFNFPAGHVEYNLPLPLGVAAKMVVNNDKVEILFQS